MEDCHNAGLEVQMVQRSPTYIIPLSYFEHVSGLGMYNVLPAELADTITMAGPVAVGAQLLHGVNMVQSMAEP